MITSHSRGWLIKYIDGHWVYADDNIPIENNERPCKRCGRMPTPEGYDACLGYIPGATSACCGHGVEEGYIVRNGKIEKIKRGAEYERINKA